MTPPALHSGFRALLRGVRHRERVALLSQGFFWAGGAFLLLVLGGGLVGHRSPPLGRALLASAPVVFTLVFLALGVFRLRARAGTDFRVARLVGQKVPSLSHDVLAAVELEDALRGEPGFSVPLARAFFRQVDERTSAVSARSVVDVRPSQWALLFFLFSLLVWCAVLLTRPEAWLSGVKVAARFAVEAASQKREPITGDIELSYVYPAYTGLSPRVVSGSGGDIAAPVGTLVKITTRADREVERAELVLDGERLPLVVSDRRDLGGSLLVKRTGAYHFAFLKASGRTLVIGPDIAVTAEVDSPPKVQLLSPAEELEINPKDPVTLKYDVADDYGLAKLELVFRPAGSAAESRVTLKHDDGRRSQGLYVWDTTSLEGKPGDQISYFLEATDNSPAEGAQKGASRTHVLRIYSAAQHRRAALEKADLLWQRLVGHLADRLEGGDQAAAPDTQKVSAQTSVDDSGRQLANDLSQTAGELADDPDSPRELWAALANVSEGLERKVRMTRDARQAYLRLVRSPAPGGAPSSSRGPLQANLASQVQREVGESERSVLYLESLLDRQKLLELKELARDLEAERRELARAIEDFKANPDPALRERILQQIQEIKTRIGELMHRMAELARGIRDEHLNAEAVRDLMKEKDMGSALDEIEKLVREGKSDEALAKLQELALEMEEMLSQLSESEDGMGEDQFPELTRKFGEFAEELKRTSSEQRRVTQETRQIRDAYRERIRDRLKEHARTLKDLLQKKVAEAQKAYQETDPSPMGSSADRPLEEVKSELENVKNALKAEDYDLGAEAAERADRAAAELLRQAVQQRQLDESFQNPSGVKAQSRKLAESLQRNGELVREISSRLQQLFPQASALLSDKEKERLRRLAGEQRQLEKRARGLLHQMDEISQMAPVFDPEAPEEMNQIAERMGEAAQRLDANDAVRGHGQQRAALDRLQKFEDEMKSQGGKGRGRGLPLPMMAGRGQGFGASQNRKVEIPDADQHQAPKEFRKDLLDAMKQGAPEKYKDQVKRYYEELVK